MKIFRHGQKGFTLIEVIVVLLLVAIVAVLAGMWIVSVANSYIVARMNMETTQKAQLALTRMEREFKAISAVTTATTNSTKITYNRPDTSSGTLTNQVVTINGTLLQLNGNTLTDSVGTFTLAYCNDVASSCTSTWSSTSRIIVITLTMNGAQGVQSTYTQRVAPRNL